MIQICLFAAAIACLLLGLSVLLNNPRSTLYRLYFTFSVFSSIWILVNGLSVNGAVKLHGSTLLFDSRLITPFSLLAPLMYYYFLRYFTDKTLHWSSLWVTLPSVFVMAFSFTEANVYLNNGIPTLGGLYPFYVLATIFNVIMIVLALYRPSQAGKPNYYTMQLSYLRIGSLLTLGPALALGAVLPLLSESNISDISPLFFLVFLVFAGLAIVRHKLFDLRIVIARSLAYILSLGSVAAIFSVAAFVITNFLFGDTARITPAQRWIYVLLALVMSFVFPPLKTFFDRATNRIFYRDAYDTQTFLDELNRTLVMKYELTTLLTQAANIMQTHIKSSHCLFIVANTRVKNTRVLGTSGHPMLDKHDIVALSEAFQHTKQNLLLIEELDTAQNKAVTTFSANKIALVARFSEKVLTEGVGYLVLGPKKSGNMYSQQDVQVLEIITNELVIAIQNALRFEEIENFNATLQQRIEEATRKLRRANEKLKALDETKDDFISMASHQLRTPLTSVKGYLSMILEGDVGKITTPQREMINQAFSSSQRMVYLIADLLNVSRLKTGKFVIETKPVNLINLVEQELSQLDETIKTHALEVKFEKPKTLPDLMLDDTKTRQVIMNFIDNAVYYTPKDGHIIVRLVETASSIEFRVEDNGIGVPRHEQQHLFTKFYRADNARKARPDGTGLGLFMAKKVVIAQGGSLIFESKEGKGSTFGFVFSKHRLAVPKSIT